MRQPSLYHYVASEDGLQAPQPVPTPAHGALPADDDPPPRRAPQEGPGRALRGDP